LFFGILLELFFLCFLPFSFGRNRRRRELDGNAVDLEKKLKAFERKTLLLLKLTSFSTLFFYGFCHLDLEGIREKKRIELGDGKTVDLEEKIKAKICQRYVFFLNRCTCKNPKQGTVFFTSWKTCILC